MITLKHLIIREAFQTDVPTLISWWASEELMQHYGLTGGIQTDIDKLKTEIEKQEISPLESKHRFMILKKSDNVPIGEISLQHLDLQNNSAEIGIRICELDERGHGYGEEALLGMMSYLFKTYHLHRLCISCFVENVQARKLYEKVGFKVIGTERDAWLDSKGSYHSIIKMDLLVNEYFI